MTGPPNAESSAAPRRAAEPEINCNALDKLQFIYPKTAPSQAEILRNPRVVAAMRRELNLEFVYECAGGIRIHAELAQTFAEIGDVAGTCYVLRRLFAHVKAAHPVFIELRDEASSGEEASQ